LIDPPAQPSRETIDPERIGALADDIAANGLLQPLGLIGPAPSGRYRVAYGHRRLLALQLLRWPGAPAIVYPPETDPAELRISENNIRENLTPLEEASEVKRLLDKGMPQSAVARVFRRSITWVVERRELLDLPADLRHAIQSNAVTLAVARVLADVDHEDYRQSLTAEAVRSGATTGVVNVWRAHYLADRDRIIGNHMVVEQIAEARAAWKVVVPCDLCKEDHEYPDTRTLRLCNPCLGEVLRLVEEAAGQAVAAAPLNT